jgi:hypothetical protein
LIRKVALVSSGAVALCACLTAGMSQASRKTVPPLRRAPTSIVQEVKSTMGYTFSGPNRKSISTELLSGAIKIAKPRRPPRTSTSAPSLAGRKGEHSECWTGNFKFVVYEPHDFLQTLAEVFVADDGAFTYRGSRGPWPSDKKQLRNARLWPERFKKEVDGKGVCSDGVLYFTQINNPRMKHPVRDNPGAFPQGIIESDYRLAFDDASKRGGLIGDGDLVLAGKDWQAVFPDSYDPNSLFCIAHDDVLYVNTMILYESRLVPIDV